MAGSATFHRSGTRSFSGISWWSTAAAGRSWRSSSVATASGFLNGCNSRFLILDFNQIPGVEVWQIGAEGGFLPEPVNLTAENGNQILLALAERADIIVDFTNVPVGNYVLGNVGPDEPFGGFPVDEPSDPASTGQVMQFQVSAATEPDPTTPPEYLQLPAITPLVPTFTRQISLNEEESKTIFVSEDDRWQRGI